MNVDKENKKLIAFWDQAFSKLEPMTLKKEDFDESVDYHRLLKYMGDTCSDILDVGCGYGYGIIAAKLLGNKMSYGFGIDPSENAVNILKDSCELSGIDCIDTKDDTHLLLSVFDDHSFDGVLCSNVLDVVPVETRDEIIKEINRLIKPGGKLLIKLNFFLTDELITKIGMKEIEENTYTINDVIRGVNQSNEDWIKLFKDYKLIEETTFDRVKSGPKDRVLLFERVSS